MKDFVAVLKNNPDAAYDYITSNYYKLSKEELKDITKELLYSIYTNALESEQKEILEDAAEELAEQYEL